jgi:replicative DNA helicase
MNKDFVTKEDLEEAFDRFQCRITEEHEKRIQMISAHYSDVLKSNKELIDRVCSAHESIDAKMANINHQLEKLNPIIEMLLVLGGGRKFAVWVAPLGIIGLITGAMWLAVKRLFVE